MPAVAAADAMTADVTNPLVRGSGEGAGAVEDGDRIDGLEDLLTEIHHWIDKVCESQRLLEGYAH